MGVWGSGPGMIQEPELEEGEACSYKDDANIDPDIALSYIGDKVQSILGHLQKDFEGGVCAENLGPKFGGYGSFLPMYQRSPSIWSQHPKSPRRIQNADLPKSPGHLIPEGPAPNPVMATCGPSTQRNGSSSSPITHPSHMLKTSSEDASVRQNASLCSDDVVTTFPSKGEFPSSKLDNPTNPRTLKVRIKVGPDRVAQYNEEIYNLGLTSSSSSEGNSPEESGGSPLEFHEPPSESPANILQMMTSFRVAGDMFLSPLHEDLLNIVRETESSVKGDHEAAPKSSTITVRILNNDDFEGKKAKCVDKSENFGRSENERMVDLNDHKRRCLGSVNPGCKPISDTVRKPEKDVQMKKRKGSKDSVKGKAVSGGLVKDVALERTSDQMCNKYEQRLPVYRSAENAGKHQRRILEKDVSVGHGKDSRSTVAGNGASFKGHFDNSEGERTSRVTENLILKDDARATSDEHDEFGISHAVDELVFEGEKKSNGGKKSGKVSRLADHLEDDGGAVPSKTHSGNKGFNRVHLSQSDVVDTPLDHTENPKHLVERSSGAGPKNSNLETGKAKPAFADKVKERSRKQKHFDKVRSKTYKMEPQAAATPSSQGVISGLEHTVTAPVVLEENWVACDRCEKWRLLPYGTKSDQLPEVWVCSMLNWLPGMNRCDISQDDTTKAVQALYLVPVPENANNFQAHADRIMSGVSSAGAHNDDQNHRSIASDQIAGQVKNQELNQKLRTAGMSNPLPSSDGKKDLHRRPFKSGSSKEVNQSLAGVDATFKSRVPLDKPAIAESKISNLKGEHLIGDDANPRKKSRKEPAQVHGKVEKIKSEGMFNVDNIQTAGGDLDIMGHSSTSRLPTKAAMKDGKNGNKDVHSGGMSNLQIRVKTQKNQMVDLPNNGSPAVKACNGGEVNTKKRKLKDSKDSQHRMETAQNNVRNVEDRSISLKDNDCHIDKKPRVPQVEEKEFKLVTSDDISDKKGPEPRVRLSGSRERPTSNGIGRAKLRLTIEDINKLREDLGCEQLSTAATSSSSKVSNSRKNKLGYMEVKGSPEESVSSSPVRMPYPNQVSSTMMETLGNVDSGFNDLPSVGSVKKIPYTKESPGFGKGRKGMVTGVSYSGVGFWECDARDEPNEPVSGVNLPPDSVHSSLVGSPYPTSVRIVNRSRSKEGRSQDHSDAKFPQLKSRKSSSSRPLTMNRTAGYALERVEIPSTSGDVFESKNRFKEETDVDNNYGASQYESLNNNQHSLSDESSIKSVRNNMIFGKKDLGERPDNGSGNQSSRREHDMKSSALCTADSVQPKLSQERVEGSLEQISTHKKQWSGKVRLDLRQGNKQGTLCSSKLASGSLGSSERRFKDSRPPDTSIAGDTSKALKDGAIASHQNASANRIHCEPEQSSAVAVSLAYKNVSAVTESTPLKEAGDVLKEAEELRAHADLIKNSGFGSESNYEYFKAALKFLYGASQLEVCGGENSKHLEMNPMQIYSIAAKLCKSCAYEYEKGHEMAAAALAYKCVEVAYMRIVYCKSSTTNRLWHDLQSSMQMVPQGESPSSSASDVDNLNNLPVAERANLSKGNGSHAGNHAILPRNRSNFVRLLDYTKDVNSAMEAAKKSQDTFAAAHFKLEEYGDKESSLAVKRVIDFSFQDVEELIRLVWLAFNSISRQGLIGSGD